MTAKEARGQSCQGIETLAHASRLLFSCSLVAALRGQCHVMGGRVVGEFDCYRIQRRERILSCLSVSQSVYLLALPLYCVNFGFNLLFNIDARKTTVQVIFRFANYA